MQKSCTLEHYHPYKVANKITRLKRYFMKMGDKMLQNDLKVIAVGKPNIEALTDGERRTFFETLFVQITELSKQSRVTDDEENGQ